MTPPSWTGPTVPFVDPRDERSGVLLLRAWTHEGRVIARIQATVEGQGDQMAQVTLGVDAIEETVRDWLRDLAETSR